MLSWSFAILLGFVDINAFALLLLSLIARRTGRRLIDLPTWMIVVTFVPIGWIYYRNSRRRRAVYQRHVADFGGDTSAVVPAYEFQKGSQFVPDTICAREVYAKLRDMNDRSAMYRRKLENTQVAFEKNTDKLRILSDELRRAQEERNTLAKDIQVYQDVLANDATIDEFHEMSVESEFQSLLMLKGVTAVRVFNGVLSILVKGRVEYRGAVYDKGDWELRLIPGLWTIWSRETRRGITKSWKRRHGRGEYPDYKLSNGSYCFGGTATSICDNLASGQYLQACELAVMCINSVNKQDLPNIPFALKRIEE